MSIDSLFIRKRFKFEAEYGQHRNWWVRDIRIAGNPLSIYLYLLSHDPEHMPTQTEALSALGLGKDAWQAAKKRLLQAGFMMEIRDRYPTGYVDSKGKPKGGQKRFRLELLDPEPGMDFALDDMILELDQPLEEYEKTPDQNHCGKSALADGVHCGLSAVDEKHLVRTTADYPQSGPATADNPQSFIGREKGLVRLGSNTQPTNQTEPTVAGARDAEAVVDATLAALLPGVNPPLTVSAITHALDGRVDARQIDLVQAVKDTLLRQRGVIGQPAAYVASVIVRKPTAWLLGATPAAPGAYTPPASGFEDSGQGFTAPTVQELRVFERQECASGRHDWGPASWPEFDRAYCQRSLCETPRRSVDPVFADLEAAEFEGSL